MKSKLKRKHWITIGVCSAVLLLYFGSYLWLRLNHTFIHRAGLYGPRVSGNRPRRSTNHFIEPGEPRIDVWRPDQLASEEDEDYRKVMQKAEERCESARLRLERLLLFFEPAAFLETCVWKTVKPNPPIPDYGEWQNKEPEATR